MLQSFLILMLVAEMGGLKEAALHSYGIVFLVARLMHGLCFGFLKHSTILRVGGTLAHAVLYLGSSDISVDALRRLE